MGINQVPGVGPQNTDIATAVAAAVPTNSSITAALPTNSTIASAVAAAVPTNASITNVVQTYSATATSFNRVAVLTNTQTWTHPDGTSSPRRVQVVVVGGGGGGGGGVASGTSGANAGGSGGGSGYAVQAQTVVNSTVSVVVGAGGTGGSGASQAYNANVSPYYGTDGNNGGYSAFGNIVAGGGFYGAGNYSRTSGATSGDTAGIAFQNESTFYADSIQNGLNSYIYASRGGSGGGYPWNKQSNMGSTFFTSYPYTNGSAHANAATPAVPNTSPAGFIYGGSFGGHALQQIQSNVGANNPFRFNDRYGWMGSPNSAVAYNTTNAPTPTQHPVMTGMGINTQLRYRDAQAVYNISSGTGTAVGAVLLDGEDVITPLSAIQSGGGSAGYGSMGNTTSANGFIGGVGMLGSGGAGGTSNTQIHNNTATSRSAGNGAAGSGYGGGGGGGSSATSVNANITCTSGNGGAGAPGVVLVFY